MINIYFFIFLIEIFVALILVLYLKLADDWAIQARLDIEKQGREIAELLKDLRKDLAQLNKILDFIVNFKKSNVRKIFLKALDVINIVMLFWPAKTKKKVKAGRFIGIKILKAILLIAKSHP